MHEFYYEWVDEKKRKITTFLIVNNNLLVLLCAGKDSGKKMCDAIVRHKKLNQNWGNIWFRKF